MPDITTAQRFGQRLDAHLDTLHSPAARQSFLEGQRARWIGLYAKFQRDAERGHAPEGERAADYVETIAEISNRLALIPEAAHAA